MFDWTEKVFLKQTRGSKDKKFVMLCTFMGI